MWITLETLVNKGFFKKIIVDNSVDNLWITHELSTMALSRHNFYNSAFKSYPQLIHRVIHKKRAVIHNYTTVIFCFCG